MKRPLQTAADGSRRWPLTLVLALMALMSVFLGVAVRPAAAASLTITSPQANAHVPSRSVTISATSTGFTPSRVDFYWATGTPDDNLTDRYLGYAERAVDGTYSVTHDHFTDGGPHLVYAQAMDNNVTVRALVSFYVDRRTGPTELLFTAPADYATVNSRTVTVRAMPVNFQPLRVEFYWAQGTPDDNQTDVYMGTDTEPAPDGSFEVTFNFPDGGPHLVYAYYYDGFRTVQNTMTFTVDTRTGATNINIVQPSAGATLTRKAVTVRGMPVNFTPPRMDFYIVNGTPDDNQVDVYMGADTEPAQDGSFEVTYNFADGTHGVYATAWDGFRTVRSGITYFHVNTRPNLTLTFSANTLAACGTVEATVGITPAPETDATVTLAANSAAVSQPGTVVVPANATSAKVTVTGMPVRANTPVTITASYSGVTATADLTVTPFKSFAYLIEDLGTPGGNYSIATTINSLGQVAGYYGTTGGSGTRAFRTGETGALVDLDPTVTDSSAAWAMNDAGRVVGYTQTADGKRAAFRTNEAGAIVRLTPTTQTNAQARDINGNGQVTGWLKAADGNMHAFYANAAGDVNDLGVLPTGTYSLGYSINNAGRIAGYGDDANEIDFGFLTEANGLVSTSDVLDAWAYPYAVNNAGLTTGEMWNYTEKGYNLFRSRADGVPVDLGRLAPFDTYGNAINAYGDIAGTAYSYDSTSQQYVDEAAIVYTDALGLADLNTLIDPTSGWTLYAANDINDLGQIVGYGLHNGAWRAFRLTPAVPNVLFGDVDGDNDVDRADVTALLGLVAGKSPRPDARTVFAADTAPAPTCTPRGFGDGRLTVADAARLARRLAGLETIWP